MLWFVAIGLSVFMLLSESNAYDLTFLTKLLKHILTVPYPYWSILILSGAGTLLSIYFGDEMMDVTLHKERKIHHSYYLLDSLSVILPA